MSIKTIVLASLATLLLATTARAQTAYCDTAPPTSGTGTIGIAEKVDVCIAAVDSSTPPNPVTPSNWTLYVNGTSQAITLTKVNETANSGLVHYTGSYTPAAVGSLALQITATGNGKESNKSSVYTLAVSSPLSAPQTPVKLSSQ